MFEHITKKKIKQVIRKMDFSMMTTKIPPNEANETKTWLWTFCFLTKQCFVPYRLIWKLPLPPLKYHFSSLPLKQKQLMTLPADSKPKFFYLNRLFSLLLKVDFFPPHVMCPDFGFPTFCASHFLLTYLSFLDLLPFCLPLKNNQVYIIYKYIL